jgi:DNA-binding CsgD family transcriptional regulator
LIQQHELGLAAELLPGAPDAPLATLADKLVAAARLELALAAGKSAAGEREMERLLAAVTPPAAAAEAPWQPAPRLCLLHGQWLLAQQRQTDASQAIETALRAAQAQGARPLEWRAHAALGRCWRALRRFEAADRSFEAARSVIEALALEIPAGELRDNFQRAALAQLPGRLPGARRRALKRQYGGLTERERGVAALVGQGRSNRAIAEALVLSERTVEKHVSNVLAKLGLGTRAEVVAWAQRNGLASQAPD